MMDVSSLRRRATETLELHRPTLIAFLIAAFSFILAGIQLFSPALAETVGEGTWLRGIARGFGIAFGPAAAILALLAGSHALLHLLGRGLVFDRNRALCTAALALFVPCLFALVARPGNAAGGVVGVLAQDAILFFFPRLFALPLMIGATLLALIYSTDWLFQGLLLARPAPKKAPPRPRTPKAQPTPEPKPSKETEEEDDDDIRWEVEDEEEIEDESEEETKKKGPGEEEEAAPEEPAPLPPPVKARQLSLPTLPDVPRPRRKKDSSPLPSLELLEKPKSIDLGRLEKAIQLNAQVLERALSSFKIETQVVGHTRGPVITMFELALKEGTKLSQITNRSDDLAIALKAESVRIVAPIPGKNTVGVEVPNIIRDDVGLYGLLAEVGNSLDKKAVPIFLGRNAAGEPMVEDLTTMPHLLIAGATGSGKSVCINTLILSILMTRRADEVRLILIDPKQVELAFFREIPHLLTSVVTDSRKASQTLDWVVNEMEDRYRVFALFGVRNIAGYNRLGGKKIRELSQQHDIGEESAPAFMPYLVIVVDELADLIMTGRKEVETAITRLAQKSRAVGIHSVLATQRPSTDVITGLIKANMPSRASFKVTSKVDSRVVLDQSGADKLLGRGDMLFLPPRSFHLVRAQGCYVSDQEVRDVVSYLKANGPGQELRELVVRAETLDTRDPREVDDLFDAACRVVLESQRGSASLLQRALSVGYTRASRLIDLMRAQGIIGEFKNAQAAEVLLDIEEYEAKYTPKL